MSEAEELLREARDMLESVMINYPTEEPSELFAKIDAYLARPADGVVVPREPTEAMIEAYKGALKLEIEGNPDVPRVKTKRGYTVPEREKILARYKAMLSAAPSAERKGGGE